MDESLAWLASVPVGFEPMVEVRIGTSGWSYDHWDGVLYPHGMAPRDRLAACCAEFAPRGLTHARKLHRPEEHWLYCGSYSDESLGWWAERIREWTWQGHSVHAYFNNDGDGNAVRNARTLKWMLGM